MEGKGERDCSVLRSEGDLIQILGAEARSRVCWRSIEVTKSDAMYTLDGNTQFA